ILIAAVCILAVVVIKAFTPDSNREIYTVRRSDFTASIKCKGEINSTNNIEINLPDILQDTRVLRTSQFKIADIIEEGTSVKKGDYIARLDQNDIISRMRNISQQLEKLEADLKNSEIDSTVRLTQLREEIKDADLDLEYNKIDLEQSVYESEAYQRKVRMNYQKAEIGITKKKRDYILERNKLKLGVQRLEEQVQTQKNELEVIQKAMASCVINSPGDGILMLGKNPLEGEKYKRGSYIYYFFPLIGMLPDMNTINSKVYVKEIDIAKINVGDSVLISFDALEEVSLPGEVTWISTMGENHKDYDMQVFSVIIWLKKNDPRLKPAMSSNNEIIYSRLNDVLTIPVNALYKEDSLSYVFLKEGNKILKKVVTPGPENEEYIVIEEGLTEGDQIFIQPPGNELLAENIEN
ncbi:MAG: hypothetical protein JXR41_15025, partial [Bacteroidales bacterium]|nr:hypothetical protein [Bacteroidales bacterium]